jgi:hypothetical protein
MGLLLKIDTPEYIEAINDLIHDGWFDTNSVALDRLSAILEVPFERERKRRKFRCPSSLTSAAGSNTLCILRFERVRDYILEESEHIGRYDFNRITYDPTAGRIKVETNIPLRFEVEVEALAISVEMD